MILIYYIANKKTGELMYWGDGDEIAGPMLYLTFEAAKEAYNDFNETDRKDLAIGTAPAFN